MKIVVLISDLWRLGKIIPERLAKLVCQKGRGGATVSEKDSKEL
jgi:hypothetical protein